MKHIAVVMNFWGKADTITEALRQAARAGGNTEPSAKVMVLEVKDDKAHLDDMGMVAYTPLDWNNMGEGIDWHKTFEGKVSGLLKALRTGTLNDRASNVPAEDGIETKRLSEDEWRVVVKGVITTPCFNSKGAADAYRDLIRSGARKPEFSL